jgi:hypothetical protein
VESAERVPYLIVTDVIVVFRLGGPSFAEVPPFGLTPFEVMSEMRVDSPLVTWPTTE